MVTSSLEALAALANATSPHSDVQRKRMLIIVNPYATTVSDRLRHLVVYALRGRYDVTAIDTLARQHATELCRQAALEGYDVVVAFGGDGTVNEVANGLAGSPTPLTCLPGGATNVFCRMLGIPNDVVDATEHLLAMADGWRPRKVDLPSVNGRHYTFSAGYGLDATVVRRVDASPRLKARLGAYYYTWSAISAFNRHYLVKPPRIVVQTGGEEIEGVTAIVQNGDPYTYFNRRPISITEGATLDGGTLSAITLRRGSPIDMPTIIWRAFSPRARIVKHRQVSHVEGVTRLRARSLDGRPIPLQVDGDYVGDVEEAIFAIAPKALTVIS